MRPKELEVADIFRRHGDAFRATQGQPAVPRPAQDHGRDRGMPNASARRSCRALRGLRRDARRYNSCRKRHCPKCQGLARLQWLADRRTELLPVPYFHVVFTVPAPIAALALQNKALVYDILFKAAAETIRVIAADPKHLGAESGMIAILHTWGQTLTHQSSPCSLHRAGWRPRTGRALDRMQTELLSSGSRSLPLLSSPVS
jgi:Transposase zinc-binding domain